MSLLDYYSKILSKMSHKRYEHYVISRFLHRLDDLEIEIQPQQYIARKEGYALADLYLPQLNIILEVDEPYHEKIKSKDEAREKDIIGAIDAEVYRIPIPTREIGITNGTEAILQVNQAIENLIELIRHKKRELVNSKEFEPWDINRVIDPYFYIQKGNIALEDNCAFHHIVDALKCFGLNYQRYQRGGVKHPHESKTVIWFPKLYVNNDWENVLKDHETLIEEKTAENLSEKMRREHVTKHLNDNIEYRIVFAHGKNVFGETRYRFKGRFKLDRQASNIQDGLIWKRDLTRVKTYES